MSLPEAHELLRKWADPGKIRAIFLDASNTLVFLDLELIAETVRESRVPMVGSRLKRAEYEARRKADRKYGEGRQRDRSMWNCYFTWMLEAAGVPDETIPEIVERLAKRNAESSLWSETTPEIRTALERLEASGRTLAVISNSDGTCREILRRLRLLPFFAAVYDSTEVGVEKPDAAIFERAMRELDLSPNETLHMGDLEAVDVLGARRAGILPVLVDPFPRFHPREFPVLRSVAELPAALEIEG